MDLTPSGALRRGICALTVAATVPYLTLKSLWLCGSTVGFAPGAEIADSGALWAGNLVTFVMDAVAVLLALALIRPWGRRIPSGLLLFPAWVGSGMLGALLLELPLVFGTELLFGTEPSIDAQSWLRPWVFAVVYGGFAVQGLTLLAGFGLHARERWAGLLADRIGDLPRTATLGLQRVLAVTAAGLAVPLAATRLYWALGGDLARPLRLTEGHRPARIIDAVTAALLLAACGAFLHVVLRRTPERPLAPALVTGWVAGGAVFAWGSWTVFAWLLTPEVPEQADVVPPAGQLAEAAQAGVGLLLLVLGALILIERAHAAADVQSAG
ncbi:hypothetical protein ACIRBX_18395 [Kitasatospora sp. NPDC096147]|uniref:hypothetical protein n=1 Tax=Kitasatospora sp. NPDC096147 TaxID=3364093 RepID=UPI0038061E7C